MATFILFTTGCSAAGTNDKNKGAKKLANPIAVFETNHGTFEVELFEDKAPIMVKNFTDLYSRLCRWHALHGLDERSGKAPCRAQCGQGGEVYEEPPSCAALLLWVVTQCRMQSMRHNKPPAMRVEDKWLYQKHLSG